MKKTLPLAALLACGSLCGLAHAACPPAADTARLAAAYMQRQPVADLPADLSLADGECGRARLNAFLGQQLGPVVGYKAGLTNPAVQKRFRHDRPILGVLFRDMLRPNGSTVPLDFAARPLVEADLLVRVKDAGIHRAKTPEEALRHIDQVIPFIELPDIVVQNPAQLNGSTLSYLNVGARLGVVGTPIPARSVTAAQLADLTVRVTDGAGKEAERGQGSDILGHPLNAVLWIAAEVARTGKTLRPGDLLSLGSFSKPRPPQAGETFRVLYEGLPGTPAVEVKFRPAD